MKNGIKYIILILLFIALVISVTVSTLYIKYEIKGDFNYNTSYYELKYSNVMMDSDNIIVRIDENSDSIHFDIPNLDNEVNISLDITNIGNKSIILDNYSIMNIDTTLDKNNIEIIESINKGDIIAGGTSKKIIIKVKNNNKEKGYFNFNIKYLFKES